MLYYITSSTAVVGVCNDPGCGLSAIVMIVHDAVLCGAARLQLPLLPWVRVKPRAYFWPFDDPAEPPRSLPAAAFRGIIE